MPSVYVVKNGMTEAMKPVVCKDEDKELQTILKNNFDLLPGDQIEPDDPCRWMLIRREMPVPDPSTGTDRWSIDFLFVDQNATPTFVECKRYLDTRSRREVVGQVLEYAANAQLNWLADDLRANAESTAKEDGREFEAVFTEFRGRGTVFGESAEEFFKEAERKLKACETRIIFFLEQAPAELKRLVEFMNAQMRDLEVLLLEARQYESGGLRVAVPTLFGFTERIRQIKRAVSAERNREPIATDWESFQKNAEDKGLDDQTLGAIRKVYDACKALQADISWGRGVQLGSFNPKWRNVNPNTSPFSVIANGRLDLHLSAFQNSEAAKKFGDRFAALLIGGGLVLPANYQTSWPSIDVNKWINHHDVLISALQNALKDAGAV